MQKRHTTIFRRATTDEWYELASAGRKKCEYASLSPIAVFVWNIIVIIETLFIHTRKTSILTPMKMKMESKLPLNLQLITLRLKIVWGKVRWYKDTVRVTIRCQIATFRQYVALGVFSIHLFLWKTYHSSDRKMVCVLNVSVDEP